VICETTGSASPHPIRLTRPPPSTHCLQPCCTWGSPPPGLDATRERPKSGSKRHGQSFLAAQPTTSSLLLLHLQACGGGTQHGLGKQRRQLLDLLLPECPATAPHCVTHLRCFDDALRPLHLGALWTWTAMNRFSSRSGSKSCSGSKWTVGRRRRAPGAQRPFLLHFLAGSQTGEPPMPGTPSPLPMTSQGCRKTVVWDAMSNEMTSSLPPRWTTRGSMYGVEKSSCASHFLGMLSINQPRELALRPSSDSRSVAHGAPSFSADKCLASASASVLEVTPTHTFTFTHTHSHHGGYRTGAV
jgi:hypothetical protein